MTKIAPFFLLLLVISCSKKIEQTSNVASFDEMLENYHQEGLKLNPLNATFAGDDRYNDLLLNDITSAHAEIEKAYYQKYLQALQGFKLSELDNEQKISYEVLKWECEINLAAHSFPANLMPVDQFWSTQLMIGQLASGASAQPFRNKVDYDNWLKRLGVFVNWSDSAVLNMNLGIQNGVVLPKSLIKKVIPQLEGWTKGPTAEHHFYSPLLEMPSTMTAEEANEATEQYTSFIENQLIPTMGRLYQFFKEDYLEAGRETSGLLDLPNGNAWYQHQIKLYTTTDMTADEVFELGKSEVARLRSEMEKIKTQVGFEGDLKAFFDHVRAKPDLMPFSDPQEVIDNFNAIHEKMKPNLQKLFDLTPKTPFEVRRTEAFREASASAEYNPGSLDGTRPGVFYVPIPEVTKYNIYSDEDLFLHEAIPGHHYQISLTQENQALPSFRRTLWYSAYGEGWALYSESLGEELGLYQDPYQYFGMLGAEMHRAIRLVVDAGMHAKGWTREEAIQYSLENEAESEASIISEIERYMAGPGQALSYKVGQLKIRELRKKASDKMGDQFDVKTFHNKVLESGCVPLKVLETKIDRWINGG